MKIGLMKLIIFKFLVKTLHFYKNLYQLFSLLMYSVFLESYFKYKNYKSLKSALFESIVVDD